MYLYRLIEYPDPLRRGINDLKRLTEVKDEVRVREEERGKMKNNKDLWKKNTETYNNRSFLKYTHV